MNSWICWTSFVLRVIRVGVPSRFISRAEKLCTRSKTAARISRPAPIEAIEDQYTATIATIPRTRVMPSMIAPPFSRCKVGDIALDDAVVDDVGVEVRAGRGSRSIGSPSAR